MPSYYIDGLEFFKQVIASPQMSITCIGFDPNLGYEKCYYGCETILPKFEEMSNHPGFQHIGFYRVDCDESPDIWKFCGQHAIVPGFVIYQNGRFISQCAAETLSDLQDLLKPHYSGNRTFPFPNPCNESRDGYRGSYYPQPRR